MSEMIHITMPGSRFSRGLLTGLGSVFIVCIMTVISGWAFNFDTGNPDLTVRWDNTLKYSAAMRTEGQTDKLISSLNQDDGDRAFDRGLISNRFDMLSEMDVIYKGYGIRISGAAWYDSLYDTSNDNDSPGTANAFSVPHNQFTDDTRDVHGLNGELLDAFFFGRKYLGDNALSFRAGQYAMQWGESLFFGNNGIAGAMSPIDAVKLLSVPNTQFKEIIRPVPQASAQLQVGSKLSVGAYYQFGWKETRLPASGSYFSNLDLFGEGGERLFGGPPLVPGGEMAAFYRGDDMEADDNGQGGMQVRYRLGEYDLGAYAILYHDKTPQLYAKPSVVDTPNGPVVLDPANFDPVAGKIGEYCLVYPENIQVYGASASTTFGFVNVATEVSMRVNTPLVSDLQIVVPGVIADNDDNPLYAVGKSFHAQVSWLASMEPSFIAREADFLGEIAYNKRVSIDKNPSALASNASKEVIGIRMVYEPKYRQVMPGLDIGVPLGLAYFPKGNSSVVGSFGPDKGGDMNVGLNLIYLDAWRISLAYTHYYGPSDTFLDANNTFSFKQSYADRDFVSFSVSRTF
ncbi:MAG: DUF1302 domain-containing protein [Pseudomonadota bacterium]